MKSICSADHIIGYNESTIAKGERNDCVVRAMASTFGLSYDSAHKFVADEFEREPRKGTFGTAVKLKCRVHEVMGIKYIIIPITDLLYPGSDIHQKKGGRPVSIPLRLFLERFPKGKYFVIKKGHAFSVIDGVVIGNSDEGERLKSKILFALKVEE
jgi:hypothetical protein